MAPFSRAVGHFFPLLPSPPFPLFILETKAACSIQTRVEEASTTIDSLPLAEGFDSQSIRQVAHEYLEQYRKTEVALHEDGMVHSPSAEDKPSRTSSFPIPDIPEASVLLYHLLRVTRKNEPDDLELPIYLIRTATYADVKLRSARSKSHYYQGETRSYLSPCTTYAQVKHS